MFKIQKVLNSFDKQTKKSLIILSVIMFFIAILEAIAIGLIIPIISILFNPSGFTVPLINYNFAFNVQNILLFFGTLVLFYIFKNIVLIFFEKKKFLRANEIDVKVTNLVLKNYINLSHDKLINFSTSEILRDITSETTIFVRRYLISVINLILEIIVIFFIFLVLFYNAPGTTLIVMSIVLFTGSIIYLFNRTKLYKIGENRRFYNKKIIQIVNEIFNSIKEITVYNKKNEIIKIFKSNHAKLLENLQLVNFYSVLPRIILEIVLIIILFSIIFFNLDFNNPDQILTLIAIFAAAAFRLFPSVGRIINSLQNIRYSKSSTEFILNQISNQTADTIQQKNKYNLENSIKLKDVSFSFGSKDIFLNTNLNISKSEKILLSGESGSGKTTLLNLLLGFLAPKKGNIFFDDLDIHQSNKFNLLNSISYIPQNIYLLDTTIRNNISFFETDKEDINRLNSSLEFSCAKNFINSLENGIDTNIGENGITLSGGQRQRIGISRAIYQNKDIYIFDEATSAIDQETEEEILLNLKKLDKTVLFISHKQYLKKYFSRKLVVKDKGIIEETHG